MIGLAYLFVFAFYSAQTTAVEQAQGEVTTLSTETGDVAQRELTDAGYVIRYGDTVYRYPVRIVPFVRRVDAAEKNPTETNEIETADEDNRRPLFYFTSYETSDRTDLPVSRPFIEIRKKREADSREVSDSSKTGKLRKKRTYCGKCGKGGGIAYVPLVHVTYPVHYGGIGGGKGCNTCGGGGGGGGSYSYSSSSAQSSSGSYGWGKK